MGGREDAAASDRHVCFRLSRTQDTAVSGSCATDWASSHSIGCDGATELPSRRNCGPCGHCRVSPETSIAMLCQPTSVTPTFQIHTLSTRVCSNCRPDIFCASSPAAPAHLALLDIGGTGRTRPSQPLHRRRHRSDRRPRTACCRTRSSGAWSLTSRSAHSCLAAMTVRRSSP